MTYYFYATLGETYGYQHSEETERFLHQLYLHGSKAWPELSVDKKFQV